MPQFDLYREMTFVGFAIVATLGFAGIYAVLENVVPFLRGGLGRV
ncbi:MULTISPECIES: hypothetical protein [unclassified Beijerinckia]|nr:MULTISPECIES: hypothetical protein [unclassified Beijerinckia]MDH7795651.1 hypothetical protein [Beijerinckia sp. GAS462]SEC10265.1 hypothetical protein SAMN05443249_1928 [Beijerinckia sp. 28-YEA-48]